MKSNCFIIIITWLTLFAQHTYSQTPEWRIWNMINSDIPSDGVKSIAIDSAGSKWLGTGNGLVKFDDTTWTIWNTSNSSLSNNLISIVVIDSAQNKWVYANNAGLTKFDGTTWTNWNTSNSEIPRNSINAISLDDTGNVWIGTNMGLTKFDGTNWITWDTSNSEIPDNTVTAIVFDDFGNIWLGADELVKFDGNNWTTFQSAIFPVCWVSSISIDSLNNIWVGYGSCGLSVYDGGTGFNYNTSNSILPDNGAGALVFDSIGNLWLSSQSLIKKNSNIWDLWDTTNSELPDNNVCDIVIDSDGNKWLGTGYEGLVEFNEYGITNIGNEPINGNPINKISFSPNPANKFIEIIDLPYNTKIYFYDITGKLVKEGAFTGTAIDISTLSPGIYILKTTTNNTLPTRFVKY